MKVSEYQKYLASKTPIHQPTIVTNHQGGGDIFGKIENVSDGYSKLMAKEEIDMEKDPVRKERMKFLYNEGVYDFSGI